MTNKQQFQTDSYLEFLLKIIEGKYCRHCKTFSMHNCKLCRKCGAEL